MSFLKKEKKWFKPMFEFRDDISADRKTDWKYDKPQSQSPLKSAITTCKEHGKLFKIQNINNKNWMQNFDPITVEDLAVHTKKVQEVEEWFKLVFVGDNSDILLLTGPVGCGKTATLKILASKHNIKVTEWITPLDIEIPLENGELVNILHEQASIVLLSNYGEYQYSAKQSTKFLDFILRSSTCISLLDNNSRKLVLVEDMPNTFTRTPSEFTEVLQQYKQRAKSPIVFICSESHTDNKNSAANLFTPALKEQFRIQHITFNAVAPTGLKSALKRVAEIMSKKYTSVYNSPNSGLIECVVNSSAGDVRSAVLNLHFACLKGSKQNLETSCTDKEAKTTRKRKAVSSSKFLSLGKDQTVSILHGVGRVLNPKVIIEDGRKKFTYSPDEIIEQFVSQPSSFVNFIAENYLAHFSAADQADKAASAISDADFLLAEWREKMCQQYGLYISTAGLMLANEAPVSAWNPVRGPKIMKIQYPTPRELQLEDNYFCKGKVLVTDYQTYCRIISDRKSV